MTFTIPIIPLRASPTFGRYRREVLPWFARVVKLSAPVPPAEKTKRRRYRPIPGAKAGVRGSSVLACPDCGGTQTAVLETISSAAKDRVHRRRACVACKRRFSTNETIELP